MTSRVKQILIFLLVLALPVYAQVAEIEGPSKPFLNQQLRRTKRRLNTLEGNTQNSISGILSIAKGGTSANLTDPDADRILFWDDSDHKVGFLTANTNVDISGTNLNVTAEFVDIFLVDGTFTVPTGVTKVYLTMVGGGGAGGACPNAQCYAGGGAGGAWIANYPFTVTPDAELLVQVGDGAVTTSAGDNDGAAGQDTVFDTATAAITCAGGSGGLSAHTGGAAVGGIDASAGTAGGYTNKGGAGGTGADVSTGGAGGGTPFGPGAAGADGAAGSGATANTGAGGGGASSDSEGAFNGGAGGSGFVAVM